MEKTKEYKMKTIQLKGKDYYQVHEKLKSFRHKYPAGTIFTDMKLIGERVICSAAISVNGSLIATGHAYKQIDDEFQLEKMETRAIGRALGIAGIGLGFQRSKIRGYVKRTKIRG